MKPLALVLLLSAMPALAQHSKPALSEPPMRPASAPVAAPLPTASNGSTGWVNVVKQPSISLADIAAMFRPSGGGR